MGAVGNIMLWSGLQELLSTVLAPSSVSHMVTGHADSRAPCHRPRRLSSSVSHMVTDHADSRALRATFPTQEAFVTILLKTSTVPDDTHKDSLR